MFLPPHFKPPGQVKSEDFLLRPITIHDVVKDYDAVMSSRDHLWKRFGMLWGWPQAELTLEQDLIDLAWHQKEGQLRSSFNYAVMSLDETRLLGCIYVDPPSREDAEAEVWFWNRSSELAGGLEQKLGAFVSQWLGEYWPFQVVTINDQMNRLNPSA